MWDNEATFSDNQALADGGVSDRIVDAGPDDLGLGAPVYLQVSLSGASEAELTVRLETADDEGMAAPFLVAQFKVPAAAVGRGGVVLAAPLPTGCRRYLRLGYAGASSGKITAGLTEGAQTNGMF